MSGGAAVAPRRRRLKRWASGVAILVVPAVLTLGGCASEDTMMGKEKMMDKGMAKDGEMMKDKEMEKK
jgi:hypothetical protein